MPAHALHKKLLTKLSQVKRIYTRPGGVGAAFPQAEGRQAMPFGDAAVQTQECTHVSEQLLAVEEGTLPRRDDWLYSVCRYLDAL